MCLCHSLGQQWVILLNIKTVLFMCCCSILYTPSITNISCCNFVTNYVCGGFPDTKHSETTMETTHCFTGSSWQSDLALLLHLRYDGSISIYFILPVLVVLPLFSIAFSLTPLFSPLLLFCFHLHHFLLPLYLPPLCHFLTVIC